ncbi:MAG: hypothetical protein AAF171_03190 [Cyanobacteria bacterium P01_A01_bin.116]
MSDHRSVQETETAAAGKVGDLTEGMIRVLLEHRAEKNNQPDYNPNLFRTAYKRYQEKGVDKRTARDAAADIATGTGSKDSPAIVQAEAQVIANAQQQAQNYRTEAATVTDPRASAEEKQRAAARMSKIEKDLGIDDRPREVKAQTISRLAPIAQHQAQQHTPQRGAARSINPQVEPQNQPSPTRRSAGEILRKDNQTAFEQRGAKPETARLASYEVVEQGKGAIDGLYTALAHQEIQHHQILKDMYQGIYEKHGVSSELASQAAVQLANGNGANRSDIVRQAHNQALANIQYPQPITEAQNQTPVSKENSAAYSTETNSSQDSASVSVDRPKENSSSQQIWDKYHSGENGVFESMAKGNPRMQQLSDQLIAKEALLAGEEPKDIQRAIAQNSPHAKTLSRPGDYARRTLKKAEQSPEVQSKRSQWNEKSKNTDQKARPSRKEAQKDQARSENRTVTKNKSTKKVKAHEKEVSY